MGENWVLIGVLWVSGCKWLGVCWWFLLVLFFVGVIVIVMVEGGKENWGFWVLCFVFFEVRVGVLVLIWVDEYMLEVFIMFWIYVEWMLGKDIDIVFEVIFDYVNYYWFFGVEKLLLVVEGSEEKNGVGVFCIIGVGLLEFYECIICFEWLNVMYYWIEKLKLFVVEYIWGEI